jgi:hypothetical protein
MRSQSIFAQRWAASIVLASLACAAPAFAQDKALAAGAGNAAPAVAAPGSAGSEASDKEANKLFDEGVKEARAGAWEKARVAMLAAFKLKPSADWAANLGKVELKASKPRDAAEHLSFFLREAQTIEPDDRTAVAKMLGEAKAQIGTATIQVSAPGAQVLVDGQLVGTAPLTGPVFVEPGRRRFEAKKDGTGQASQEIHVTAGATPVVDLKLVAGTAVQGRASARHEVQMSETPTIERGSLQEQSKRSKVPAFVIGGVGMVALGIGVPFIGVAVSQRSEATGLSIATTHSCRLSDPLPTGKCKDLASAAASSDTFGNVGVAALVVAGVAVASVATYLLWPAPHDEPHSARSVHLLPTASTNGGGLVMLGSF